MLPVATIKTVLLLLPKLVTGGSIDIPTDAVVTTMFSPPIDVELDRVARDDVIIDVPRLAPERYYRWWGRC